MKVTGNEKTRVSRALRGLEGSMINARATAAPGAEHSIHIPCEGCEHEPEQIRMLRGVSGLARVHAELAAYKAALDRHAIVAVTDRKGAIISVNEGFCRISGFSEAELLGADHRIVNSGFHPRHFFVEMWRRIGRGEVWHGEICNRAKGGELYWVDTTIVPFWSETGAIEGYVSIRYEVTERKRAEAALFEENGKRARAETLLRDIIETIPDGIAAFDREDRLVLCNEAFKKTYPRAAPAMVEGARFEDILRYGIENGQFPQAGSTPARREAWLRARLRDHANPERTLIQALGEGRWVQVREKQSVAGNVVGVRTDITELKRAEATIKKQAEEDPLTGLSNRTVLGKRLARAIGARRRDGNSGALFLLDLDNFKSINDTLGHDAGDALLRIVADRLRAGVGSEGVVARFGGDEFGIVYPHVESHGAAACLATDLLSRIEESVKLGHRLLSPRCSLGVAFFPFDGSNARDLIKHADIALYEAKARGRGTFCFFDGSMKTAIESRQALADSLAHAIAAGDLDIALQPKTRFADGRHVGFEALVRWRLGGQMVPPPTIIEIAEETGLIGALGAQVLDLALATARRLSDSGVEPGPIAVNVAASQLRRDDFVALVQEALSRHALPPAALEIEVTENVLLDEAGDQIQRSLQGLRALGIRVALDDFGTGYASLAHLKRFAVDALKIDRSFVSDIAAGHEGGVLARTIITLAHSLGLEVVAEGVETQEQYAFLKAEGCDHAQGYFVSRPIPRRDVATWFGDCRRELQENGGCTNALLTAETAS